MDNNKIIGNNCFGLLLNSNELDTKSTLKNHLFYKAISDIYFINSEFLTILMKHNCIEGIYDIGNNLKIEFFNVKYTFTEFKVYTDNPDNSIISGKITLSGINNRNLTFDYYKPDVLNTREIHPDDDNLLAKCDAIRLVCEMILCNEAKED